MLSLEDEYNILIVDDQEILAEAVSEYLREEGFESKMVSTGHDAIDAVKKGGVDLVLLDINLPDISGFEVAKEIKKVASMSTENATIPIIMLSARDSEQDIVSGLKHADDYVVKPFSYNELSARINAIFRLTMLQRELIQSRKRYNVLFNNIPDICFSMDEKMCLTDMNNRMLKLFGKKYNEMHGTHIKEFIHKNDMDSFVDFINDLDGSKDSLDELSVRILRGKDELTVLVRGVSVKDSQIGEVTIVSMKDITREIRIEREQKKIRQQVYRSAHLATVGTLASGTAHELNNPLAAILGFADAILKRVEKEGQMEAEELSEYVSVIKNETLRCRDVVDNLSKFSRDLKNKNSVSLLSEVVQNSLMLMRNRFIKKNIAVDNRVAESPVSVSGDEQKISQSIVNIFSNCADFLEGNGRIDIFLEAGIPKDKIVVLVIENNGPAIPVEIMHKIFDPFFTTKRVGNGVGVGLTLTHVYMEEIGGNVNVVNRSKDGDGVRVELEFLLSNNGKTL